MTNHRILGELFAFLSILISSVAAADPCPFIQCKDTLSAGKECYSRDKTSPRCNGGRLVVESCKVVSKDFPKYSCQEIEPKKDLKTDVRGINKDIHILNTRTDSPSQLCEEKEMKKSEPILPSLDEILVRDRTLRNKQCSFTVGFEVKDLIQIVSLLNLEPLLEDASQEQEEDLIRNRINEFLVEGKTGDAMISRTTPSKLKPIIKRYVDGFFGLCRKLHTKLTAVGLREEEIPCELKSGKIPILFDSMLAKELFASVSPSALKHCYSTAVEVPNEKRGQEHALLVKEAESFLKEQKTVTKKTWPVSATAPTNELLSTLLDHSSDVVIGELHEDISPKKALIDNMAMLKRKNAIIALEHLFYEPYGQLLDEYISGKTKTMPPKLSIFLKMLDKGHRVKDIRYGFYALVESAKLHGVRIVPFETEASNMFSSGLENTIADADRFKTMNYMNKLVVDRERHRAKVVHLVGSAHVKTRLGVLGISELHGNAPALVISDGKGTERKVDVNVDGGTTGISADFHIAEPVR